MSWRLAKSLETLRSQINVAWPGRSKDSDGSIGDEHHSARESDHNPDHGVVHAIDITHDPKGGFDSYAFADLLLKRADPRLKYVISNRRIGSGPAGPSPGKWRKYSGINAHDHHCHISVVADARADDIRQWDIGGTIVVDPEVAAAFDPPSPTLRKGDQGEEVAKLQKALGGLKVDGNFGPVTEQSVRNFQTQHHLVADGVAGPATRKALA